MSTARKILNNTAAQIAGKLFMGLLSIATIKILTNYLTIGQYGNYNFIYNFLALFGILGDLGLYTISVREMSKDQSQIPRIVGNILSIRTVVGACGMLLAIAASFFIPETKMSGLSQSSITTAVALGAFTVFLALINGTITTIIQTHLKMHQASIAMIIGRIAAIAYMAYTVFIAYTQDPETGFFHLLTAGIIGNVIMLATSYYCARKLAQIRYRFDFDFWREILQKSIPFGIALILSTIYFRLNGLLLTFMKGAEENGIYSVAAQIMNEAILIALYFTNSLLPILTKSINGNDGRHQKIIQYSFDFLTLLALPVVAGGMVIAYPLINIISEPKFLSRLVENFYGSDIIFQIMLVTMFFGFLTTLFSFLLVALNKQIALLKINLGAIALNLGLNAFMIPLFTSRGAAFTSIIAEIYLTVGCYWIARRHLKFCISLSSVMRAFFAAAIMALVVLALRDPTYQLMENKNLILLIPLGAGIYAALLLLFRAVPKEAINTILRKSHKAQNIQDESTEAIP